MRNRDKTKTYLELVQSKAMHRPRVLLTLIGGVRAYGGVGSLESMKSRAYTDPWIPGLFGQSSLGAQPRQA